MLWWNWSWIGILNPKFIVNKSAINVWDLQEEIAKDLLSGDYEEETQSSADDLTPSVTSHETTDFFPRTLRCE